MKTGIEMIFSTRNNCFIPNIETTKLKIQTITIPVYKGILPFETLAKIWPPTTQLTILQPTTPRQPINATNFTNHHPNRYLAVTICLHPDLGPMVAQ